MSAIKTILDAGAIAGLAGLLGIPMAITLGVATERPRVDDHSAKLRDVAQLAAATRECRRNCAELALLAEAWEGSAAELSEAVLCCRFEVFELRRAVCENTLFATCSLDELDHLRAYAAELETLAEHVRDAEPALVSEWLEKEGLSFGDVRFLLGFFHWRLGKVLDYQLRMLPVRGTERSIGRPAWHDAEACGGEIDPRSLRFFSGLDFEEVLGLLD